MRKTIEQMRKTVSSTVLGGDMNNERNEPRVRLNQFRPSLMALLRKKSNSESIRGMTVGRGETGDQSCGTSHQKTRDLSILDRIENTKRFFTKDSLSTNESTNESIT